MTEKEISDNSVNTAAVATTSTGSSFGTSDLYYYLFRPSSDNHVPSTFKQSLNLARENAENILSNANCIEKLPPSHNMRNNHENKTTSKSTNGSLTTSLVNEPILSSNLSDLSKELFSAVEESHKMYKCMQQNQARICAMMDKIVTLINENIQSDPSIMSKTRETAAAERNEQKGIEQEEKQQGKEQEGLAQERLEQEEIEEELEEQQQEVEPEQAHEKEEDKNEEEEDKNKEEKQDKQEQEAQEFGQKEGKEIVKQRRAVKRRVSERQKDIDDFCSYRKFTLPPEYDENDSKWTLKYREKALGLVELIPNSDIYVNAESLKNIKNTVKNSVAPVWTLPKLLLREIFTHSALITCSFTGSPSVLSQDGDYVRPGLDKHGRTVLLDYVENYYYANNMPHCRLKWYCPKESIRSEMQSIRREHEKEENEKKGGVVKHKVSKKQKREQKRGPSIKFILPPEYDENDSRWTLRYREKSLGLVELMPQTGIYVNAAGLKNVQNIANKTKTKHTIFILAELLLSEIFTRSALTTCTFAGPPSVIYYDSFTKRPGLDRHGRTVLLEYVKNYVGELNWACNNIPLMTRIDRKIINIRKKYS